VKKPENSVFPRWEKYGFFKNSFRFEPKTNSAKRTHCNPGLLKVESCRIKIAIRKFQFNPKAFTFNTFDCSFTLCA